MPVTETVAWADFPFLPKLTSIGILEHMGLLFGLPNQLALAALAVRCAGRPSPWPSAWCWSPWRSAG